MVDKNTGNGSDKKLEDWYTRLWMLLGRGRRQWFQLPKGPFDLVTINK